MTAGCLTVKHCELNGHESIIQAVSVSYMFPQAEGEYRRVVAWQVAGKDGDFNQYEDGKVYVMNEAGATVGYYDLTHQQPWKAPSGL